MKEKQKGTLPRVKKMWDFLRSKNTSKQELNQSNVEEKDFIQANSKYVNTGIPVCIFCMFILCIYLIGDFANAYPEMLYTNMYDSIEANLTSLGVDTLNLQQEVDFLFYLSHKNFKTTKLICGMKNGFFPAIVIVNLSSDTYAVQSEYRNFKSPEAFKHTYWIIFGIISFLGGTILWLLLRKILHIALSIMYKIFPKIINIWRAKNKKQSEVESSEISEEGTNCDDLTMLD